MKNLYFTLCSSIALLSACSSGSGTDTTRSGNKLNNQVSQQQLTTTRVFANDAGNMGDINTAGTTLTAQTGLVSGMALDYDADKTSTETATFAISKGTDGEAVMIVDGVTYNFVSGDRLSDGSGYNTTKNPNFNKLTDDLIYLTPYGGENLASALDANNLNYLQVWEYGVDSPDATVAKHGFAVVGSQTAFADVAGNAAATYSGSAELKLVPVNGYSTQVLREILVRGELEMSVDFLSESISGNLNSLSYTNGVGTSPSDLSGNVSLDATDVNANGEFAGVMSPDQDFQRQFGLDAEDKGSYSGGLFGPEANQIGGTMGLTSSQFTGYGYFTADKDPAK